jgi:hypothetical protein
MALRACRISFARIIDVSLSFFLAASLSDRLTFSSSLLMARNDLVTCKKRRDCLDTLTSDLTVQLVAFFSQLGAPFVNLQK